MELNFGAILQRWELLLSGATLTLQLSVSATVLGFIIGTLCAMGRNSKYPWLVAICATYVEIIRNTPFLVQIFLIFFGLSTLGFRLDAVTVAILALTINVGAYTGEIVRSGFDSVHAGQWEAAECLGLSRMQTYWHVVILPSLERVYPSLTSQFILLMLASSITSQISVGELTGNANFIQGLTFRPFETYLIIGLIYLALSQVMRIMFWIIGYFAFPRRRRLGTQI